MASNFFGFELVFVSYRNKRRKCVCVSIHIQLPIWSYLNNITDFIFKDNYVHFWTSNEIPSQAFFSFLISCFILKRVHYSPYTDEIHCLKIIKWLCVLLGTKTSNYIRRHIFRLTTATCKYKSFLACLFRSGLEPELINFVA